MVDVTLIGTGALQPLPHRALASAAITLAGRIVLLDCGEGTQAAAKSAGISLMKIDLIALTHYHGDHTYGLPGLLQSMGMAGRTEPVVIVGPAGLTEAMEPFRMLCPYLPFELRLRELLPGRIALQTLLPEWPAQAMLTVFSTAHRVSSQGYRFDLLRSGRFLPAKAKELGIPVNEWKTLQSGESVWLGRQQIFPEQVMEEARRGISVVYTGDTAICAEAAEAAKDADVLICEATYGENEHHILASEHGHMTFAQAAHLAHQAGAKVLWLTHYSPMIDEPTEFLPNATTVFANTLCGCDGMKETLRYAADK